METYKPETLEDLHNFSRWLLDNYGNVTLPEGTRHAMKALQDYLESQLVGES